MADVKALPKFAAGGYIPGPPIPWWTPRPGWVQLHPDETVMQPGGLILRAWEFHLIRAMAGGRGD